jgi:YbbR domain-containing protein
MKKLSIISIVILFLIAAFTIPVQAAVFSSPVITLANASTNTNGTGTGVIPIDVFNNWTIQANITGAPTAVTVYIDGNVDGTTYTEMANHTFSAGELTATQAVFSISNMPSYKIRARWAITNGTAATITIKCGGVK